MKSDAMLRGGGAALTAAALFGCSTPAAKELLGVAGPATVAALFYLGSGVALGGLALAGPPAGRWIHRDDRVRLALAVICGGIVAPTALFWGLARVSASTASLLLALEAPFTALIAGVCFHEPIGRRLPLGLGLVAAGGALLGFAAEGVDRTWGAAAIVLATLAWALDNNLTRDLGTGSPVWIAAWKGMVGGLVNLGIGRVSGGRFPSPPAALAAALVGAVSYGASLALFVSALRTMGAARTGAWFATAPFFGAAASVLFLGEPFGTRMLAAAALVLAGTWVLVGETHDHEHRHEALEHVHVHSRDEHHDHAHEADEGPEPHAHPHRHGVLVHAHSHLPDVHHRHVHPAAGRAGRARTPPDRKR